MITTPTTISDLDLHNVTGGNLSLTPRTGNGGGGNWSLGGALQGAKNLGSNAWEGAKNQWTKTKDAWSSIPDTMCRGFLNSIGLGR